MDDGVSRTRVPPRFAELLRRIRGVDRTLALGLFVCALAGALAIHAAHYWPFFSDDAFIALRYAKRFARGDGLTWTAGERVEGYTDLLWVLMLGIAAKLGVGLVIAARVLGFLGVLAAALGTGFSPSTGRLVLRRAAVGGPLIVLTAPLSVWAIGGLEHGCMAGVLALAIVVVGRRGLGHERPGRADLVAGLPLAALALLRADGVVLVAAVLAGTLLVSRPKRLGFRRVLLLSLPAAVAVAAQLFFRRAYYGAWQPNTALAKLAFNSHRLFMGLDYLYQGYSAEVIALILALLASAALLRQEARRELAIPWFVVVTWSVYQVAVGGDIFPGYRQLVFPLVALAFIVATQAEHGAWRLWQRAGLAVALVLHVYVGARAAENVRAKDEVWEWDGFPVAAALSTAFAASDPLLAVDAAGALPYWSDFRSVDMLGLTDRYIAQHPPHDFGSGTIGHELGDGAYVLSRHPDIIAFDNAAGGRDPLFLSGRQLVAMPAFRRDYQWIRIRGTVGNRAYGEVWLLREGGKIGIQRSPGRVLLPGYFFTGEESSASASIDYRGKLVAYLSRGAFGQIPSFQIGPGQFTVHPAPETPLVLGLRCSGRTMTRLGPGTKPVLSFTRTSLASLSVAPQVGTQPLESVELDATTEAPTHGCKAFGDRLVLASEDVAEPKAAGTFWADAGNVLFDRAGLVVKLDGVVRPSHIEVSVDNDDTYVLEARRAGAAVPLHFEITAETNVPGLAVHQLTVDAAEAPDGIDEVWLTPQAGDGRFAMGHLILEPAEAQ